MVKWKFRKDDVNVERYMDILKYKESVTYRDDDYVAVFQIPEYIKTMMKRHLEELESVDCFNRGLLSNTRKLSASFSMEFAADMLPAFGMDFEKEFAKSLSREIAEELDKEIMRVLNGDL